MYQEEKVVCTYLLCIFKSVIVFVKMDEPGVVSRVGGDDIMWLDEIVVLGLGGNIAPVWYIFDSQRRLQFDFVALFFKRSKRLKFKYKIRGQVETEFYFECPQSTVWTSYWTREVVVRIYMLEDNVVSEFHLLSDFSAFIMIYTSTRAAYSLMTLLFYSGLLAD